MIRKRKLPNQDIYKIYDDEFPYVIVYVHGLSQAINLMTALLQEDRISQKSSYNNFP